MARRKSHRSAQMGGSSNVVSGEAYADVRARRGLLQHLHSGRGRVSRIETFLKRPRGPTGTTQAAKM